jgi:hypothetical protein
MDWKSIIIINFKWGYVYHTVTAMAMESNIKIKLYLCIKVKF